jgi:hypothetical protein
MTEVEFIILTTAEADRDGILYPDPGWLAAPLEQAIRSLVAATFLVETGSDGGVQYRITDLGRLAHDDEDFAEWAASESGVLRGRRRRPV